MALYGAAIWATPMNERKRKLLSSIQRPLALAITKGYRTTSTAAATILARLSPLHIRAAQEAAVTTVLQLHLCTTFGPLCYDPEEYETKRLINATHPSHHRKGVVAHTTSQHSLHEKIRPVNVIHSSNYGKGVLAHTSWKDDSDIKDQYYVYTDGLKVDGQVGCGLIVTKNKETLITWKCHMGQNNSVFQAEAIAIRKAIELTSPPVESTVNILTDSLSVIHALRNLRHASPIIAEIQDTLKERSSAMNILISWIKDLRYCQCIFGYPPPRSLSTIGDQYRPP
ncbi:uncharacterized protein LOC118190170 [Stegodyphus dumicola]|uniref:uncharacterized protein LOC118190170 n=1 Tax=Stegodyphus dumicola TaxID=202533 RepID=UPI0015AD3F4B|nr:uncharacterized protein LOC118190170 [Stegodyphus dumicola]